jgi:hypothetical protein
MFCWWVAFADYVVVAARSEVTGKGVAREPTTCLFGGKACISGSNLLQGAQCKEGVVLTPLSHVTKRL